MSSFCRLTVLFNHHLNRTFKILAAINLIQQTFFVQSELSLKTLLCRLVGNSLQSIHLNLVNKAIHN